MQYNWSDIQNGTTGHISSYQISRGGAVITRQYRLYVHEVIITVDQEYTNGISPILPINNDPREKFGVLGNYNMEQYS